MNEGWAIRAGAQPLLLFADESIVTLHSVFRRRTELETAQELSCMTCFYNTAAFLLARARGGFPNPQWKMIAWS